MPSQVYYSGDFYYATTATTPGQSPLGAPEAWRRIDLPAELLRPAAMMAAANLMHSEGQNARGLAFEAKAQTLLDDQWLRSGKGDSRSWRPSVMTR